MVFTFALGFGFFYTIYLSGIIWSNNLDANHFVLFLPSENLGSSLVLTFPVSAFCVLFFFSL